MSQAAATTRTTGRSTGSRGWSPRRVLAAGGLIVALGTVTHVLAVSRTWFWFDDLGLLAQARHNGAATVTEPYYGHVMPLGRLLTLWHASVAPLDYHWLAGELLVLYLACCLGVLRLLSTLVGPRPGILFPLAYFVFSSFLIPAMTWWSVGITHLPALLATILALDAHVRHLRSGRLRDLLLAVGLILLGLGFAELTMLAYLPIVLITFWYFATGSPWQRVAAIYARHRRALVTHTTLVVVYLGAYLYLNRAPQFRAQHVAWSEFASNALGISLPSAIVGGPGHWAPLFVAFLMPGAPAIWARLLGLAAIGALLTLTAATRDHGLRAWSIPLSQVVAVVLLLGYSRSLFGPGVTLDLRFFTPVALGMALGLTLAFLPILGADDQPAVREASALLESGPAQVVVAVGVAGFATYSLVQFPLVGHTEQHPREWYAAVEQSVARHRAPVQLVESFTPDWLLGPPYGTYRNLLPLAHVTVPEVVQDHYFRIDDAGRLYRPRMKVVRREATPAPDGSCGYRITGSGSVPLDGPIYGYGWYLELRYDASARTPVVISVGDVSTPTTLLAGRHRLLMHADAQYDAIRFTGLDPAASVCLPSLRIGTLRR